MSQPEEKMNPLVIRTLMDQVCPIDSSLDAFCIDHFPHIHRLFSSSMDRIAKVNMLLIYVPHLELYNLLIARAPRTSINRDVSMRKLKIISIGKLSLNKLLGFCVVLSVIIMIINRHINATSYTLSSRGGDLSTSDMQATFHDISTSNALSTSVINSAEPMSIKKFENNQSTKQPFKSVLLNCTVQNLLRDSLRIYLNHCIREIHLSNSSRSKKFPSFKLVKLGHYQLSSNNDNVFETGIPVCIKSIRPTATDPMEIEVKCKRAK